METEKIVNRLYVLFGTDSGVLFGIKDKSIVSAIVDFAIKSITDMQETESEVAFEDAAKPLIKWLCENHHPHVTAIVTCTNAELLEGIKSTGKILDYVKD